MKTNQGSNEPERENSTAKDQTVEDAMLEAVAKYLKQEGWNPVVISADRIQGPADRGFNYELVIRFTGSPSDELEKQRQSGAASSTGTSRARSAPKKKVSS